MNDGGEPLGHLAAWPAAGGLGGLRYVPVMGAGAGDQSDKSVLCSPSL